MNSNSRYFTLLEPNVRVADAIFFRSFESCCRDGTSPASPDSSRSPRTTLLLNSLCSQYNCNKSCSCLHILVSQFADHLDIEDDCVAYQCLCSFLRTFVPFLLLNNPDRVKQRVRLLLHTLLQYHDPPLANLLVSFGSSCGEAVGERFFRLFASDLRTDNMKLLWDFFLTNGDPSMPYMVAVALLLQQRQTLASRLMDLSEAFWNRGEREAAKREGAVSLASCERPDGVAKLCADARALLSKTPGAFTALVRSLVHAPTFALSYSHSQARSNWHAAASSRRLRGAGGGEDQTNDSIPPESIHTSPAVTEFRCDSHSNSPVRTGAERRLSPPSPMLGPPRQLAHMSPGPSAHHPENDRQGRGPSFGTEKTKYLGQVPTDCLNTATHVASSSSADLCVGTEEKPPTFTSLLSYSSQSPLQAQTRPNSRSTPLSPSGGYRSPIPTGDLDNPSSFSTGGVHSFAPHPMNNTLSPPSEDPMHRTETSNQTQAPPLVSLLPATGSGRKVPSPLGGATSHAIPPSSPPPRVPPTPSVSRSPCEGGGHRSPGGSQSAPERRGKTGSALTSARLMPFGLRDISSIGNPVRTLPLRGTNTQSEFGNGKTIVQESVVAGVKEQENSSPPSGPVGLFVFVIDLRPSEEFLQGHHPSSFSFPWNPSVLSSGTWVRFLQAVGAAAASSRSSACALGLGRPVGFVLRPSKANDPMADLEVRQLGERLVAAGVPRVSVMSLEGGEPKGHHCLGIAGDGKGRCLACAASSSLRSLLENVLRGQKEGGLVGEGGTVAHVLSSQAESAVAKEIEKQMQLVLLEGPRREREEEAAALKERARVVELSSGGGAEGHSTSATRGKRRGVKVGRPPRQGTKNADKKRTSGCSEIAPFSLTACEEKEKEKDSLQKRQAGVNEQRSESGIQIEMPDENARVWDSGSVPDSDTVGDSQSCFSGPPPTARSFASSFISLGTSEASDDIKSLGGVLFGRGGTGGSPSPLPLGDLFAELEAQCWGSGAALNRAEERFRVEAGRTKDARLLLGFAHAAVIRASLSGRSGDVQEALLRLERVEGHAPSQILSKAERISLRIIRAVETNTKQQQGAQKGLLPEKEKEAAKVVASVLAGRGERMPTATRWTAAILVGRSQHLETLSLSLQPSSPSLSSASASPKGGGFLMADEAAGPGTGWRAPVDLLRDMGGGGGASSVGGQSPSPSQSQNQNRGRRGGGFRKRGGAEERQAAEFLPPPSVVVEASESRDSDAMLRFGRGVLLLGLSLVPPSLGRAVEAWGFKGDQQRGLQLLYGVAESPGLRNSVSFPWALTALVGYLVFYIPDFVTGRAVRLHEASCLIALAGQQERLHRSVPLQFLNGLVLQKAGRLDEAGSAFEETASLMAGAGGGEGTDSSPQSLSVFPSPSLGPGLRLCPRLAFARGWTSFLNFEWEAARELLETYLSLFSTSCEGTNTPHNTGGSDVSGSASELEEVEKRPLCCLLLGVSLMIGGQRQGGQAVLQEAMKSCALTKADRWVSRKANRFMRRQHASLFPLELAYLLGQTEGSNREWHERALKHIDAIRIQSPPSPPNDKNRGSWLSFLPLPLSLFSQTSQPTAAAQRDEPREPPTQRGRRQKERETLGESGSTSASSSKNLAAGGEEELEGDGKAKGQPTPACTPDEWAVYQVVRVSCLKETLAQQMELQEETWTGPFAHFELSTVLSSGRDWDAAADQLKAAKRLVDWCKKFDFRRTLNLKISAGRWGGRSG
uniref:Rab-GAP TBC domain-containing protein n=1 Tax=Chromera velia CCMP2878 TaxID=1169474 RepID=A0A0G4H987_9ALVE|eukprot:Cvel_5900.t1-p1 / transcript=Cvel_5900.t1 / gene=Cvel_5900 / organism=Chromera_velia_CCMP2878 / gene_product=hypothetical protein / transcript_product=hypothetical protein / location=Cvel_scaffold281:77253-87636(+) / protein_length=1735 / sequence_SO=supercontig / SO=protein_coding / is_pseudo=false